MRLQGDHVVLSATDLANFLSCRHRTALDLAATLKKREWPPKFDDPLLEILIERGKAHEKQHVESLNTDGRRVVDLNGGNINDRAGWMERTRAAMREGADVIVQAALGDHQWYGLADLLQRVEKPSALGAWSYEVADTKLALETKAGTIMQLGLYSELLAREQGARPEYFHVITPHPVTPRTSYRVDDYAAYFRLIRRKVEEALASGDEALAVANYPEPVEHCYVCHWQQSCKERRKADDHLSLVAGITRIQRRELETRGVETLTALADVSKPLAFKPKRGSRESYERVRDQALVQLKSRATPRPLHELRAFEPGMGLARLPDPTPGDVFLDLEGDPYAVEKGREYLFGLVTVGADGAPVYQAFWGMTDAEERSAFEQVMDLIAERRAKWPGMHVYHYAPYEPTAFKKLMGRYATRGDEMDALLRSGCFIDLYAVVKQAMYVGVERYSIKSLEPVYGYVRDEDLRQANRALHAVEAYLERGLVTEVPVEALKSVEAYNRDDCVSTLRLRDWLETVRRDAISAAYMPDERPIAVSDEAPVAVDEKAQRVEALRQRLLAGLPEERRDRSDEQQGRWVLAYLLDFHRREDKATWWEYFRLRELPEEDLTDEPNAVNGLRFVADLGFSIGKTGKPTRSVIHRYEYPPQEMEIDAGEALKLKEGTWGEVTAVDRGKRTLDVKKGPKNAEVHVTAAFAHNAVSPKVMEESLFAIAEDVANSGSLKGSRYTAAADLLSRSPRIPSLRRKAEPPVVDVDVGIEGALALDGSVLAIQGPPGAGKTYMGARMIRALVAAGKRVGVTANSHKVIRKLLEDVRAAEGSPSIRIAHKCDDEAGSAPTWLQVTGDNNIAIELLTTGAVDVLGGTSWLWSRPELQGEVDVLFIDEAGQLSLANAIAVSRAAKNLVLLGDPQQLEQPIQGSHPDGVAVSALEHLLGEYKTMPPELGMFLPVTHRMAPSVCAYTSELFYEGKLRSRDGLEVQVLCGTEGHDGSGVRLLEVAHAGNRNYSEEEVDAVEVLVKQLTMSGATWVNGKGETRPLAANDMLVVSPYNAQVTRLTERLAPLGVRVGTVDKFQGQEGAVVIYSMATSRPEDAPRGMEFLYSANRINVATSRARCSAIVVASPALFEPQCTSPRQMQLANALCRYREMTGDWLQTCDSFGHTLQHASGS